MYSESMYILVTLILGCVSLLYWINFSLHSFLVPYVTLDHLVTRIVRIFFFSDLTKGPHNYHRWNICLYEVHAEPDLMERSQGSTGGCPYTGQQSSAFPPLGRDQGQGRLRPSALFVCCLWTFSNDFRCNPCNSQV